MSSANPHAVIRLRGVRQHNLKGFDLDLPLHRLIVVTGLSGSGKSSLAFDTLFAEGQRRYIETFSPYARQFFDRMDKPRVDSIEGIPPAIAIEQRNAVRTTRSTVGTMTELCDYLKTLWPHIARLHCRGCGRPVKKETPRAVWETLAADARTHGAEVWLTFDLPLSEKLSLADSLALIAQQGYQRLLLGGETVRVEEAAGLLQRHAAASASLTVVQDRLRLSDDQRARFAEACEQAYHFGKGKLAVRVLRGTTPAGATAQPGGGLTLFFSDRLHCADCNIEYAEPTPALFSFNHPLGACPACKGFGRIINIDYGLAVPDRSLTLAGGAVKPWRSGFSAECQDDLMKFCHARKIPTDVPFHELPPRQQDWVLNGDPGYGSDEAHEWPRAWYGVKGYFRWLESKAYKMHVRVLLSRYRSYQTCPACAGRRLQPDALLYRVPNPPPAPDENGPAGHAAAVAGAPPTLTLADFYQLPIRDAHRFVERLAGKQQFSPGDPLRFALDEIRARLGYLVEVGLGYLTLDRPTRTLSGGETERVNLTTCLGTRLVNTLFELDEPSVGLHPRDTARLVRILEHLRDAGNTVVVVEHEAAVMRAADQIVDLGPGHGETGGRVVFQGSFAKLLKSPASLTGQYLSGRKRIEIPPRRPVAKLTPEIRNPKPGNADQAAAVRTSGLGLRTSDLSWLTLRHATRHNLRDLTVHFPLGRLVCLTGVSGSGKTTLVREVLLPALEQAVQSPGRADDPAGARTDHEGPPDDESATPASSSSALLTGAESLGGMVLVDQSSLGKTPRSNPAVYVGAFDDLREFFAQTDAARQRGLNASAFSFNSAQGQCERCRGAGFEKIEMQFLSDVFIRCPDCGGRRYRPHILEVKVESRSALMVDRHVAARRRPLSTINSNSASILSWSIADLLDATVDEVIEFLAGFADSRPAARASAALKLLQEVGLGYLRLGQPINTLSGGESQRLKLARHLAESVAASAAPPASRRTLFLFDEPTTGLHFEDIRVLLQAFQRLVNAGHSVLVIEHNLEVIKCADWVIDLGPDAGDEGGRIVATGTPEDIAACPQSHTGRALREVGVG
jgi:excinuclease ABC subunit A